MANPIETLKKIKSKSWTEIRARGGQALAGYSEQIGLSGKPPSDEEFLKSLDESKFGGKNITAEILVEKFYEHSASAFFQSFAQKEKTLESFRHNFGEKSAPFFIEQAEAIVEGKFDLLGFENLDFGAAIDWHFEPLSKKRAPLKHWKQFDDEESRKIGDPKIIWELNRCRHFFTLGAAYWLTGDERYAATFVRHLDSWMRENPPGAGINWSNSMEVSFRAVNWIWAFHFFKDSASFTPELFRQALKFLCLHGRHIEKYLSTYYSPNTHLTSEALGLFYLGTQLPFFERAANWRKTGEDILLAELDRQILPDGVYFEQSTWYQRYTADFYTQFFILQKLNGGNLPEKAAEKIQSALDFMMAITRPDGTTPLVGDDDGGRCLPLSPAPANDFRAVLSTGAAIFGRGDYKFVAGDFSEETLWLLGADGAADFENLQPQKPVKNSVAFKDGGYFVMRDGWAKTDNFLLADCGDLGALNAGHAHADALSIDLTVGGKSFLIDAGSYSYNESDAARNRFRSTEAHNTLTIDGKSQSETGGKFNWQTKAQAKLHRWIPQDRFDFFEGSHDGYERLENAPATHARGILVLKNDYWIMRDFVAASGAHNYDLNFHFDPATNPQIIKSQNGDFCIEEKSGAEAVGLRLFTFGDNGDWRRDPDGAAALVYGKSVAAPVFKFASSGTGAQEFFTFLLPNETGFDAPEVFESEVSGGRAFVIKYRDYRDVLVFADGAGGQIVRTEFFNTNFRFLWARLSADEDLPEEFVLVGGTHFSTGGREIVNLPQETDFVTARRLGSRLNVRTPDNVFSVSLPQKKTTIYVLKNQE